MATNTLLTPTMITREALRILHQKLNFIGGVNKQYDSQFAQSGAKIGNTLNVRKPPKYTTRSGGTITAGDYQNSVQRSTPLVVNSQYGVDVSFTSVELTLDMDDFSERHIEPAMAQLAAKIEGDCLSDGYKYIANYTNATTNSLMTYKYFQQNSANITKGLFPLSQRAAHIAPDSKVEFMDAVKGLFQATDNIKDQYREAIMGRTGGFDCYENTLVPAHTTGSLAGTPLTDGANQGTSDTTNVWSSQTSLAIDGATSNTTLKAGDIITISGVYDVHPETKVSTGKLKTFVVQSDVTLTTQATGGNATIKPALIYGSGNGFQNCTLSGVSDTDDNTVTRIGAASSAFGQDIFCHKDAFAFASADLEDVTQYGAWGARRVMDGISMRIGKQWDVLNDAFPCRIDVLFGFDDMYASEGAASRHMYEQDLL